MQGVKTVNGEIFCADCNQKVSKDKDLKLNFCPKCGNPLNIDAMVKLAKYVDHEKTVLLYNVIDRIDEGDNAKSVCEEFIKELNEE